MATTHQSCARSGNGRAIASAFGLLSFSVIVALLCCALDVEAGDWHQLSEAVCSNCHTVHYSEDGQPLKEPIAESGGPFSQLLLASNATSLCLMCHDGSMPDAPDVLTPSYPAAGGHFDNIVDTVDSNPNGHDLGTNSAQIPPGSVSGLALSCVSCHDPHGNSNFRNLLFDPAGSVSSNISLKVQQTNKAGSGHLLDSVYVESNILYQSGMSNWCNDCHPDFHGTTIPDFRHPQDVTIYQKNYADYNYWSGNILNRVRVQADNATVLTPNDIPSFYDQVFCLSCHKAHGSDKKSSLIYADGAEMLSTCQQCHNQ